ncbi:hypothetical protein Btru_062508 [Bulinus truncatus]|nr:hypothetical protein Btru_062508 [Bulinus truncatus]
MFEVGGGVAEGGDTETIKFRKDECKQHINVTNDVSNSFIGSAKQIIIYGLRYSLKQVVTAGSTAGSCWYININIDINVFSLGNR